MYVCKECGHVFGYPYIDYGEVLEHFGRPCKEVQHVSPCCQAAFNKAYECSLCGEIIVGKYVVTDCGDKICDNCYVVHHALED